MQIPEDETEYTKEQSDGDGDEDALDDETPEEEDDQNDIQTVDFYDIHPVW